MKGFIISITKKIELQDRIIQMQRIINIHDEI